MVSRAQAIRCGFRWRRIRHRLARGQWQRLHRGVYATFSGIPPRESVLWAAVLLAGPGAMLSHESAAEVWGLLTERTSSLIRVTAPVAGGRARGRDVRIHHSVRAAAALHPNQSPPRTRLEETVVDLTQTANRLEDAIAWLTRAVGGRFTTAPRLLACIASRPKLRWRSALCAALGEVHEGSHSPLELAYVRNVERAHGLPRSQRQVRRDSGHYDDVRYRTYAVRVELDGRAAHPAHHRWRDMRRDNAAAEVGDHVLRYGSADIRERPCHVATQVASVLRSGGWTAHPRRCTRPDCSISA